MDNSFGMPRTRIEICIEVEAAFAAHLMARGCDETFLKRKKSREWINKNLKIPGCEKITHNYRVSLHQPGLAEGQRLQYVCRSATVQYSVSMHD